MVSLLVVLILVGALLYMTQLLPIDATVKQIIYIVMVVGLVLWVLRMFLGHEGSVVIP
jgi:hypothetical protein